MEPSLIITPAPAQCGALDVIIGVYPVSNWLGKYSAQQSAEEVVAVVGASHLSGDSIEFIQIRMTQFAHFDIVTPVSRWSVGRSELDLRSLLTFSLCCPYLSWVDGGGCTE